MRVASWNVFFRSKAVAERQGQLLRSLEVDLVMLQELNPDSADILRSAAGLDWLVRAVDLRARHADDRPVRRRGVAIAGHGLPPRRSWTLDGIPLPERTLAVSVQVDGTELTAVSYHAPPGVTWGIIKPRQAITLARWLAGCRGPVLLGADANTPEIDAPDFASTRTHWHSGSRSLHGEPGDDLMFGPAKIHHLEDAMRRWLADHPDHATALAADAARPNGPLAVTHYTGKRKNSPGSPRRFDSVWTTAHWRVKSIDHLYDAAIQAGSDHALVIADIEPTES
jgi:endonuclease/exonuclease/phosphatase family metal-dependent hydrolase